MEEPGLVVIYDIQDDRTRLRISEACLDYGLERIQYSAFAGRLTRNKREELFLRLQATLEEKPGKILVQPVCEKDLKAVRSIENKAQEKDPTEESHI